MFADRVSNKIGHVRPSVYSFTHLNRSTFFGLNFGTYVGHGMMASSQGNEKNQSHYDIRHGQKLVKS